MGFVTNALGITGSGPTNEFQAEAPVNKFFANSTPLDTSNYTSAIANSQMNARGMNQQWSQLADQLRQQAAGQGPSLAQLQLNQATQQQQAQAASAIASQRGINPAMAARLVAQNQAQIGQQSAGQSAQLSMAEQMGARQQLAGVLGQQQAGSLGLLGAAGQLQQGQNEAAIKNRLGTNAINQATAAQNAQLNLGAQQINAGVAGQNATTNANVLGGLMQGAGAAATFLAHGGTVPGYAGGGLPGISGLEGMRDYGVPAYGTGEDAQAGATLKSALGGLGGMKPGGKGQKDNPQLANSPDPSSADPLGSPYSSPWPGADPLLSMPAIAGAAQGGQIQPSGGVSGPSSHLGRFLRGSQATGAPGTHVEAMAKLERGGVVDFRSGGDVPGKAQVQGDSPKNDTVPAMVSPGEAVLPRSIMQSPNAPELAAEFVRKLQRRSGKSKGYERVARARKGA